MGYSSLKTSGHFGWSVGTQAVAQKLAIYNLFIKKACIFSQNTL